MRKFNLLKTLLTVLFFVSIVFNVNGQDWTTKSSSLYYVGSEGKVYMEPDYNAMAVYLESDNVTTKTEQKLKTNLSAEIDAKDIDVMDSKGMVRIKSAASMKSISTPEERKAFLKSNELKDEGAYELLPAFKVGDKQVWFTKRITIKLNKGVFLDDIAETLDAYDASYIKNIINESTYLLKVENIENQLPLIQELNDMGVLVWGEPDFKVDLVKSTNDPMYADQWHLNNTGGSIDGKALVADIDINAPEAWTITTGASNVVIAVIDDGMEAHEDMPSLLPGYTPVNGGDGTPSTSGDGHGQQVAGLISAQHNSIGVAGIAPGAGTFSVNIFAPNTTNADVAEGIVWAVDQGADVLSNSWGFGSCTYDVASITDAFAYAANNGRDGLGCISLVASGNDFFDCVSYPANLSTVTAVGGISGDGERSMYSNYGPALDICSPSDDDWVRQLGQYYSTGTHGLRTIDREGSNGWYSGNYSEAFGGTSGATPQVSAVAALVLSVNSSLSKSEVENILYSTAKNVGDENEYGAGLVDAYSAVTAASGGGDEEAPTAPTNLASNDITSNSFTLSWTASTDNVGVTGYDVYQDGANIGSTADTYYNVTGLTATTTYTYMVKAKDAAGNVSAASSTLDATTLEGTTNTAPVADAGGPYSGDEGTVITFDGTGSSDADGDPLTYNWDFGDGATGTGATTTHTYSTAGSYTATLTVSDGTDSDQATAGVTVNSTSVDQPMVSAINLSTRTSGPWLRVSGIVNISSNGQGLSNAYVEGYWSGGANSTISGYTGTDGNLALEEVKSKNTTSFTFTVSSVTRSGYYWDTENSQTSASTASGSFGLQSGNNISELTVYPNPVNNGILNILLPEVLDESAVVIYDITGSIKLKKPLTNIQTELSVNNLSSGIYILKIEGHAEPKRIIIN